MFDYAERRRRLDEVLEQEGIDALFLGLSSDLEYLTGFERNIPTFGNVSYAHGWVGGAFLQPGKEPTFLLPRMFARWRLQGRVRSAFRSGPRERPAVARKACSARVQVAAMIRLR